MAVTRLDLFVMLRAYSGFHLGFHLSIRCSGEMMERSSTETNAAGMAGNLSVEGHMADHDLRNGEHSGTCCEVANPIDAQDDADVALSVPSSIGQAPSEALNRADRQGAQKPRYVLIADDDRGIMDALALIVAEVGFTPLTASDGRQALALSRQTRPDLVITDLRMPYLDGASLIAALHADAEAQGRRAPPIILMTALTHLPEHTIIADALLLKPFDMMALIDLLQRLLPPLL